MNKTGLYCFGNKIVQAGFYEHASVNLEDVVFSGEACIIRDTITHEKYCAVSDKIFDEIGKKHYTFL